MTEQEKQSPELEPDVNSQFWVDFERIYSILMSCRMDGVERIRACRAIALYIHDEK